MRNVNVHIAKKTIACLISDESEPELFFFHGGGRGREKEKLQYLMRGLKKFGICSCAFDFGGVGESTGNFFKTSLATRVIEARKVIRKLAPHQQSISICGFSLGGYVAIKLTKYIPIQTLILFCPALYDQRAYHVSFGPAFSKIIRKNGSWRKSDALSLLKAFFGNFFMVVPECDEVVPKTLSRLTYNSVKSKKKKWISLPGSPHQLHPWIKHNTKWRNTIVCEMSKMIKQTKSEE